MLEYDWEYAFICDECGERKEFYRGDLQEAINKLKKDGWQMDGGVHLCPSCLLEKQEPCVKCRYYDAEKEACFCADSENFTSFVFNDTHCEFWANDEEDQ